MVERTVTDLGAAPNMPFSVQRYSGGVPPEVETFWYSIYVDEMGLELPTADHERGRIHDLFAERGHTLVARDGEGAVMGTMLTVLGSESSFGYYAKLYGISDGSPRISITSKMLIAEGARPSRLVFCLAAEAYRWATSKGIETDYCDSQKVTLPLFRRLGYRRIPGSAEHPVYGTSICLRLDCLDRAHLESSGSPLARHCPVPPRSLST